MIKQGKQFLLILCGVLSLSLGAQEREEISFDFEHSLDSTGWRTSSNASRLYTLPIQRVGRAYVQYNYTKGNTLNYNQAEKQNGFTFISESYYRISPRLMLYGAASFTSENENQVAGSALYHPENKPFDLTFMDETNKGNRKREEYHLEGVVGYQLSERWSLGGKFDYTAINMARTKDLRHNNKILSLQAGASTSYKLSNKLSIGADYQYDRYIETLTFNTYGTTDQQFMTLINFGAFSGRQELFDSYGYTAKGASNPLVEHRHRLGLQMAWQVSPRFRIFNELHGSSANGYYGKKATSSVVYTEHTGSSFSNQSTFLYKGQSQLHQLVLGFSSWECKNYENEWRSETSQSGNTVINYYGQNRVGEKKIHSLWADYLIAWGEKRNLPTWQLKVGTKAYTREVVAIIYPYYRTQKLKGYEQLAIASHQMDLGKCTLWIDLGVAYRTGSGADYTDGVYTTPSTEVGTPQYQNHLLANEYGYLTANRIVPQVGARLTFTMAGIDCFAQANYEMEAMLKRIDSEKNQQNLALRLGINF